MSVHWCVCVCMCVCVVVYTRACQREHARRESKRVAERERQLEFSRERVSERAYKLCKFRRVSVHMFVCRHFHSRLCMNIRALHAFTCVYACIYVCVPSCLCLCMRVCVSACACVYKNTRHTHSTNPSLCHTHAGFTISHTQLRIRTRGLPTFNHQYLTAEYSRLSECTIYLHIQGARDSIARPQLTGHTHTSSAYAHEFCRFVMIGTGWRRPIGCLKLQINFGKRATDHRALLLKITYKDKASYASSSPYTDVYYSSWAV